MPFGRLAIAAVLGVLLGGCSGGGKPAMPDVTGKKLDVAKSEIKRAGFEDKVKVEGGGVFGVLKDSNWEVCEQTPEPGEPLTAAPRLRISRECDGSLPMPTEEPSESTSPVATPSTASLPPGTQPIDITVDQLLDKLNANDAKTGDRFHLIAELFESDAWSTGATGEYSVYMKAKNGMDDLFVFVDQKLTRGWRNGTTVDLVVQVEDRTINGETSGGWLVATSVKTISL